MTGHRRQEYGVVASYRSTVGKRRVNIEKKQ